MKLIQDLVVEGNLIKVTPFPFLIDQGWLKGDFWFEYPIDIEEVPKEILLIPFYSVVIPITWVTGMYYDVDEMDDDFRLGLDKIKSVFKEMYPIIKWNGKVETKESIKNSSAKDGAGLLFGGGVDSVKSLVDHQSEELVLFCNGGNNIASYNIGGWGRVKDKLKATADAFSKEVYFVNSNFIDNVNRPKLNEFGPSWFKWWPRVMHAVALLGVPAPIVWKLGLKTLYIASTHTPDLKLAWGSDPEIDEKFSMAGLKVIHDSYNSGRQSKVKTILDDDKKVSLYVCYWDREGKGSNCDCCEKCMTLGAGVVIEGGDPRDWGMNISPEEVLKRVRWGWDWKGPGQNFAVGESELFVWEDIRARALANESSISILKKNKDFMDWFRDLDFKNYKKPEFSNTAPW
jgi:hypothetical protein